MSAEADVTTYHIRKPLRASSMLKNRRGGRKLVGDGNYCGAPETRWDIKHSWTPDPSCPGFELCPKCMELRNGKGEAA